MANHLALATNGRGDRAEREADTVANHVLTSRPSVSGPFADSALQRRGSNQALAAEVGPLPAGLRSEFEARFGRDFGAVRLHTGARAAASASRAGALAYTVGSEIVFGAGQYAPDTVPGRHLLAHELTHVVQQASAGPSLQRQVPPDEAPPARPGMGDLRIAEARLAEEERIKAGCPVKDTGTLSKVSWGETSGLYPHKENRYKPELWDAAKKCELLRLRMAVHSVGNRGESVHTGTPGNSAVEKILKPYHYIENFLSLDKEIADPRVRWFYLAPDKPAKHRGVPSDTVLVKSYGPFWNVGGGDVPKGETYVSFYRLADPPAPEKK